MSFDARFEREIISQAARDPKYRKRALRIVRGDHEFGDSALTFAWKVMSTLRGDDKLNAHVLTAEARREFNDEEERDDVLRTLVKVLKNAPESPYASLGYLQDYIDHHALTTAMDDALKMLSKGKVKDAKAKLRGVTREADTIAYRTHDWAEEFDARMKARKERKENPQSVVQVPLKFLPTIDRALGGGLSVRQIGLIVGTTGRGKSIVATNAALFGALQGFTTVYISTEMGEDLVATRADAKFLDLSYNALRFHNLTDDDIDHARDKFDRMMERIRGKLRIVSIPVRRATTDVVEEILDEMADEGRTTQLLILDSADHMKPSAKTSNRRDRETEAYWEVKSIADEREIPIWTTSHAPKDVVNKIATAENVGETYDKARIADVVMTLNQTKSQKEERRMRIFMPKYREGRSNIMVEVSLDLDRMHIEEIQDQPKDEKKDDDEGDE